MPPLVALGAEAGEEVKGDDAKEVEAALLASPRLRPNLAPFRKSAPTASSALLASDSSRAILPASEAPAKSMARSRTRDIREAARPVARPAIRATLGTSLGPGWKERIFFCLGV